MASSSAPPTAVLVPSETTSLLPNISTKARPIYGTALSFVVVPAVIITVGVVALMRLEGWPMCVSLDIVSQMVTTVGYGDMTVKTDAAKLFMTFYALAILTVLAHYYNLFTKAMLNIPSTFLTAHLRSDFVDRMKGTPSAEYIAKFLIAMQPFIASVLIGCVYFYLAEGCVCERSVLLLKKTKACIDTAGYNTCVETGGEVKTFVDILYMTIITLCTIGFGDKHPEVHPSYSGFIFETAWLLVGVAATTASVAKLSMLIFGIQTQGRFEALDALAEIDEDAFKKIDTDNSGTLSRVEYVSWVLVKYGLASDKLVDDINSSYDLLDKKKTNNVRLSTIAFQQSLIRAKKDEQEKKHFFHGLL
eukprot:TRINITY_DN4910_c0_g1_i1.p1 TRINITY_DN4910_c0_g1~~TRINITY_DN4910_c0_g1_i1.p1  ORF type:complete len:361 (-),score=46.07 TRINITY_DN4910_c0_g1_i1:51-1133(-)